MSFLIADSGSTKTDWIEISGTEIQSRFRTSGINPDIQSEANIELAIKSDFKDQGISISPSHVFFYGAGMSNHENRNRVASIFKSFFGGAEIEIEHDLLAAARAACFHEAGIACILGTGSNSCLYDGSKIINEIGGQGYIFGDEGSGADLGKALIGKILNKEFPESIAKELSSYTNDSMLELRRKVYMAEKPNVFLAQFSKFIKEKRNQFPELNALVKSRFEAFLEATVLRYSNHTHLPVHFIGSIATVFSDILKKACEEKGLTAGRIVRAPIDELVRFHSEAIQSSSNQH